MPPYGRKLGAYPRDKGWERDRYHDKESGGERDRDRSRGMDSNRPREHDRSRDRAARYRRLQDAVSDEFHHDRRGSHDTRPYRPHPKRFRDDDRDYDDRSVKSRAPPQYRQRRHLSGGNSPQRPPSYGGPGHEGGARSYDSPLESQPAPTMNDIRQAISMPLSTLGSELIAGGIEPSTSTGHQTAQLNLPQDTDADSAMRTLIEVKIQELVRVFTPSEDQRGKLMSVLRDIREAVRPLGLKADVYGSLYTGLLIPSSDIDCVMQPIDEPGAGGNHHGRPRMPEQLNRFFRAIENGDIMGRKEQKSLSSPVVRLVTTAMRRSSEFYSVKPIVNAKVPIVKCEHRRAKMKVDLSFERDGLQSSQFLCDEFQKPGNEVARALIVLVKTLIASWGFDDPSTGGLGSFPTSIMVLWFLQTEVAPKYPEELKGSLAVLFTGFLKYFGCDFNCYNTAIDYVRRTTFEKPMSDELYIVNPVKPNMGCAKAAHLYAKRVVPNFASASKSLANVLDSTSQTDVEAVLQSLFKQAVPQCMAWRMIRHKAQQYNYAPQHQWDSETHIYTGGVI